MLQGFVGGTWITATTIEVTGITASHPQNARVLSVELSPQTPQRAERMQHPGSKLGFLLPDCISVRCGPRWQVYGITI